MQAMKRLSSGTENSNSKMAKKIKSSKVLVFPGNCFPGLDKRNFTIHEDDYRAVSEIVLKSGMPCQAGLTETQVRSMVEIRDGDEERRVYKLKDYFGFVMSLPTAIGELGGLSVLDFSQSQITELPRSIGKLKHLTRLDLSNSKIESFPPSHGTLLSLRELDLSHTAKLLKLPREIGDLISLRILHLGHSGIQSLPSTIERLKNLEVLYLFNTEKLRQLPKEIGKLSNLITLDLYESNIQALPPEIGRLKRLKHLDLTKTLKLKNIPESIGKLARLETLKLYESGIVGLPVSMGNLKNVWLLDLRDLRIRISSLILTMTGLKYISLEGNELPMKAPPCERRSQRNKTKKKSGFSWWSREKEDVEKGVDPSENRQIRSHRIFNSDDTFNLQDEEYQDSEYQYSDVEDGNPYPHNSDFEDRYGYSQDLHGFKQHHNRNQYVTRRHLRSTVGNHYSYNNYSGYHNGYNMYQIQKKDPSEFLLKLAKNCPLLGCLGMEKTSVDKASVNAELGFWLAHNRARARKLELENIREGLWPILLHKATNRGISEYAAPEGYKYASFCDYTPRARCNYPKHKITKAESILWMLLDGRESFLWLLIHRGYNSKWIESRPLAAAKFDLNLSSNSITSTCSASASTSTSASSDDDNDDGDDDDNNNDNDDNNYKNNYNYNFDDEDDYDDIYDDECKNDYEDRYDDDDSTYIETPPYEEAMKEKEEASGEENRPCEVRVPKESLQSDRDEFEFEDEEGETGESLLRKWNIVNF